MRIITARHADDVEGLSTMSKLVQETLDAYIDLRKRGQEPKVILETLRLRIQLLDPPERSEIVRLIRTWESEQAAQAVAATETPPAPASPPVATVSASPEASEVAATPPTPEPPPVAEPPPPPAESATTVSDAELTTPVLMDCPHCGKPNPAQETLCYSCGGFLRPTATFETVHFPDPDQQSYRADFFGADSTLVLRVQTNASAYRVRPQDFTHEIVVGRSDGGTLKPDIDLGEQDGGQQGVSRLHLCLQYNSKECTLSVSDMRSSNGTFINGQRLHPEEVRVLRHGDELRLGRMVFRAYFYHDEKKE
jgi:hypothetical protein